MPLRRLPIGSHDLAKQLLALPDMPVVTDRHLVLSISVHMVHDFGVSGVDDCQSDTKKKPLNCFSCNVNMPRLKAVFLHWL